MEESKKASSHPHCCKCWSAQAWKLLGNVHVPKPVHKHVYSSSVQGVAKQ